MIISPTAENFVVNFFKLYSENIKTTNIAMNLNYYFGDLNRNPKYSDTHKKNVVIYKNGYFFFLIAKCKSFKRVQVPANGMSGYKDNQIR